jgi:hypothetical protein
LLQAIVLLSFLPVGIFRTLRNLDTQIESPGSES